MLLLLYQNQQTRDNGDALYPSGGQTTKSTSPLCALSPNHNNLTRIRGQTQTQLQRLSHRSTRSRFGSCAQDEAPPDRQGQMTGLGRRTTPAPQDMFIPVDISLRVLRLGMADRGRVYRP